MKNKILTAISTIMLFIPWTILMQVCVVINSIYAVGAIAIIGMNIVTRIGG